MAIFVSFMDLQYTIKKNLKKYVLMTSIKVNYTSDSRWQMIDSTNNS